MSEPVGQSEAPIAPFVYVDFMAQIRLARQDVIDAGNDVVQAVQDRIGHTGALVIEVEAEEESNQ